MPPFSVGCTRKLLWFISLWIRYRLRLYRSRKVKMFLYLPMIISLIHILGRNRTKYVLMKKKERTCSDWLGAVSEPKMGFVPVNALQRTEKTIKMIMTMRMVWSLRWDFVSSHYLTFNQWLGSAIIVCEHVTVSPSYVFTYNSLPGIQVTNNQMTFRAEIMNLMNMSISRRCHRAYELAIF